MRIDRIYNPFEAVIEEVPEIVVPKRYRMFRCSNYGYLFGIEGIVQQAPALRF